MVSPSKHQHQQQQQQQQQQQHRQQPSRENKSNPRRTSHVRIQKGLKPLEKKSFYLDIKNHVTAAKLEAKIKELGGTIELFLVRSVSLVISDRVDKTDHTNSEKHRWICASGGSGGPRSLRSIEVPTPTPTPPTPLLSSECPSSNLTNLRGQTTQRSKSRVDAMLERALTQPQQCSVDPLDNAHNWGIPIWATEKLQAWLDKIYASFNTFDTYNLKQLKQTNQRKTEKDLKVKHLKGSYIKFESFNRITRPVFLELSSWPTLNFDGDLGSCPFDTKKQGKRESKLTNKEIKENKEAIESTNRVEGKEMTRRPRATAARARRTEQLVAGYCEICHIHYDDLSKHLQSEQHLNFVGNDDNFLSLDTLINAGANVQAFLKLNRTKDIEKDCDCFPNGDGNLHNAVLPEEKVNKNTKTLSNFSVDEIKIVNGARRNLNLKLSSPHNLRTRAKHESGHLLRSKGSPWHEVDKSEKLYDKLEGFTIKKRSKGTIWIEEDDPEEKYAEEDILRKESKQEDYKRPFSNEIDDILNTKEDNISSKHSNNLDSSNLQPAIVHNNTQNGIINSRRVSEESDYLKSKDECNGDENACALECMISVEKSVIDNSYTENCKPCKDLFQRDNCTLQAEKVTIEARKLSDDVRDFVCNENNDKSEEKDSKVLQGENNRCMKPKHPSRLNRRGSRSIRGRYRHRLSVEERLIEDNRAYYKVEVLGNKLRSSAVTGSGNLQQHTASKDDDGEEKKEVPLSSEKPVVVRFKRVRKSELSLLSDEAESFMFGEPKRDDSSEQTSDNEQSSVLPKDTENSETNETANSSMLLSSPLNSSPVKQEIIEEDSQDSVHLGRARKRRRTQAEAFIKDNTDYYKFETPGSRLRYQAPLTGIKDTVFADSRENTALKKSQQSNDCKPETENIVEKIYPSKPSTEIEKMQFSFEAIPKSEPWYQTYQRQDAGAEFWHCFSECDAMKPFLLPYEIENFHETLMKMQSKIDAGGRKRGRGRGVGCVGRSPRKSPRCHASTLAIMSTIIRKREQQQSSTLCTIEESPLFVRSRTNTPKPEQKQDSKSDLDEELKEIAKTIDDMLSAKDLDDSFEPDVDLGQADVFCGTPKGAPSNLLELLDNYQDIPNCLENNSSCASSECGETNIDTPLKRRKRRKNRTGWPVGNKMKKKIQTNSKMSTDCERESLLEKGLYPDRGFAGNTLDTSSKLPEGADSHTITTSNNNVVLSTAAERLNVNRKSDTDALLEICTTNASHKSCHEALVKRDRSVETVNDDSNMSLSANTGSYVESLSISENTCDDTTNKNYLSNKDYPCRKDLSKIEEISENDELGNDENHENQKSLFGRKDVNAITERNLVIKSSPVVRKQRQRDHVTVAIAVNTVDNNSCESRDTEIENRDNIQLQQCRKETESGIVPKKYHNTNSELSSPKRQLRGGNCEENSSENTGELLKQHGRQHGIVFAATRSGRIGSRKRIYSRKRQSKTAVARNNLSSSDHHVGMVYDDENCKKDAYLSITSTCNKKQSPSSGVRSAKRKSEAISSSDNIQESSDPMLDQCALSERVISPSSVISSTELEQRRSSIEFQPVVRMMKLDDQVDMDHGILSTVTVASNRRLRSSGSSPRSNNSKPPKKRIKSGRGHFGRWLKSS